MRYIRTGIVVRLAAAAAVITAAAVSAFVLPGTALGGQASPAGSITVIASWTGMEGQDFGQVLSQAEKATGVTVNYTGTRALPQLIAADIQQGKPPDVAILPSPGTLLQYKRQGYLRPLYSDLSTQQIMRDFGKQWFNIMTLGTGELYTLPIKADVQNLVWYDPQEWRGQPMPGRSAATWSELVTLENKAENKAMVHGGAPWCVGLDSTPVSGWPGTDWIGDILLHQAGTAAYSQWADGTLSWTSPQVIDAWQTFGNLVNGKMYGGVTTALVNQWNWESAQSLPDGKEPDPMFPGAGPPGCYFQDAPSFITLPYQNDSSAKPVTDYDYFPFPEKGLPDETSGAGNDAWEVSADLLAVFNDTPAVERFVRYLATQQAQEIWPNISGGGASSADSQVPLSKYPPDPIARSIATVLAGQQATLCFNASDDMPVTLQDAFYQGVMEYLQNPGQLPDILGRLDQVRMAIYNKNGPFGGYANFSCGP
jgi:alpha-glucoside transport system substrate-binding protein